MLTYQDIKRALDDYDQKKGVLRQLFGDQRSIKKLRQFFNGLTPVSAWGDRALSPDEREELDQLIKTTYGKQNTRSWYTFDALERNIGQPSAISDTKRLPSLSDAQRHMILRTIKESLKNDGSATIAHKRLQKFYDKAIASPTMSGDLFYEFACLAAFDKHKKDLISTPMKRWIIMLSQYGLLTPDNLQILAKHHTLFNDQFNAAKLSEALRRSESPQKMFLRVMKHPKPGEVITALDRFHGLYSQQKNFALKHLKYADAIETIIKHDNPVDLVAAWNDYSEYMNKYPGYSVDEGVSDEIKNITKSLFKLKQHPRAIMNIMLSLGESKSFKNGRYLVLKKSDADLLSHLRKVGLSTTGKKPDIKKIHAVLRRRLGHAGFDETYEKWAETIKDRTDVLELTAAYALFMNNMFIRQHHASIMSAMSTHPNPIGLVKSIMGSHSVASDLDHLKHYPEPEMRREVERNLPFFPGAPIHIFKKFDVYNHPHPKELNIAASVFEGLINRFSTKQQKKLSEIIYSSLHPRSTMTAIERLAKQHNIDVVIKILQDKDDYALALAMLKSNGCATKATRQAITTFAQPIELAETFILLHKMKILTPDTIKYVSEYDKIAKNNPEIDNFYSFITLLSRFKNRKNSLTPELVKILVESKEPVKSGQLLLDLYRKISIQKYQTCLEFITKHPNPIIFTILLLKLSDAKLFNRNNIKLIESIDTNIVNITVLCAAILAAPNIKLNQDNFENILKYSAYWSDNLIHSLRRVPPHLFTQQFFNRILILCQAPAVDIPTAQANIDTLITAVIQHAQNAVNQRAQNPGGLADPLNPSQSTHTASVHKSVSDSAKRLIAIYGKQIDTEEKLTAILNNIAKWAKKLQKSSDETNKENAAKNGLARLIDSDFVDPTSKVSTRQLLAMFWLALQEDSYQAKARSVTAKEENPTKAFEKQVFMPLIEGLYESAREYNLDAQGNDKGGVSKAACQPGSFNKLMEKMVDVHPVVEILVYNKETALLRLQKVVLEKAVAYLQKADNEKLSELEKLKGQDDDVTLEQKAGMSIWDAIKDDAVQTMLDEGWLEEAYANNKAEFNGKMAGGYFAFQDEFTADKLVEKERERRNALAKQAKKEPAVKAPEAKAPEAKAPKAPVAEEGVKESLLPKMRESTHRKARTSVRLFDKPIKQPTTEQPTTQPRQPSKKNRKPS